MINVLKADWLRTHSLVAVFDAIKAAGGEIRVNGGAVRNALMDLPVDEIDLSTTLLPAETVKALEAAGLKAVPTGLDHGTITAVSDGIGYEITTLRQDVETDGRRAVVRFGTDWTEDARRRDLTMNALYCDREGRVYDPLDGMDDLTSRTVRFIGDAGERISEDYLRILRFFRFFAYYGDGRPDADGLKACARLKEGLSSISVERIWHELRKMLGATDPSRGLLWMRTTGVLSLVLPESDKWGIDLIPALVASEKKFGWQVDAYLRLAAIIRPDGEVVAGIASRLKLSKIERDRMLDWAMEMPVDADCELPALARRLYVGKRQGVIDRLKLQLSSAVEKGDEALVEALGEKLAFTQQWTKPVFPVKGQDLLAAGAEPGVKLGKRLSELEKRWIHSGFSLSKAELLKD